MKSKRMIMYTLIVLLPTAILCLILGFLKYGEEKSAILKDANLVATVHQRQMDQFIGDTITSLEVLALTLETNFSRVDDLQSALTKTGNKDPRYGDLYFLTPEGDIVTGTDDSVKQYIFKNKPYIETLIRTKHTTVSDRIETLKNSQPVIAVAAPVLQDTKLKGILIAQLRVDHMTNIMKMLTPDTGVFVKGQTGPAIMKLGKKESGTGSSWIKKPLERVSWHVYVKADHSKIAAKITPSIVVFGIIFLAFFHLIYMFLHTLSLKRQAEREKAQNEAQKLELVGTLAAGTAHEIRNPLTGIKGLVQLLSEKYKDPDDQFYFSIINKEINRINQIASEFLILGKPAAHKLETIDLREILLDMNPLILSEASLCEIDYQYSFGSEKVIVNGTKDQMKQVLFNITKNAFEAMEHGGKLTITLGKDNRHAKLVIADTGEGIPKELLNQIFQPFYTSKEHGTGLGLIVCQRIIQTFGGRIIMDSKEGAGTSVTILLALEE